VPGNVSEWLAGQAPGGCACYDHDPGRHPGFRVQRSDNLTAKVVARSGPDTRRQEVSGPAPPGYRRIHMARKRRSLPESSAVPHQ